MTIKSLSKIFLNISGIVLLISLFLYYLQKPDLGDLFILLFFILFLIGINGSEFLRGFSFTIWVIAAATLSMIYPEYITSMGGFKTENLIVPLIQLIMFGMGTTMGVKSFVGVLKMPKGVLIGLFLQFSIMPLIALGLTILFNFPPEIAAGVILIGCVPCGVSSNILNFLSKGSNACSPFCNPVIDGTTCGAVYTH